jgi:hypothetical protein
LQFFFHDSDKKSICHLSCCNESFFYQSQTVFPSAQAVSPPSLPAAAAEKTMPLKKINLTGVEKYHILYSWYGNFAWG